MDFYFPVKTGTFTCSGTSYTFGTLQRFYFLFANCRVHIRDETLVLDGKLVCKNPSEYKFMDE